ncbi:MAG: heme ABC exporter ATP-binding protein CcmA [Acidimicrobiales bacterium]
MSADGPARAGARAVDLADAVVVRGGFPLLAGVTVSIEVGTLTVLRGPNGAGKTSLLRLLAGLEALSGGRGVVVGVDLARADRRQLRRRVGWVGHEGSFYDDLTAGENLRFAARALGRPDDVVAGALARVGLASRARTTTRRLSAGQRRRLALAWLLVRRAELWLLDEPYGAVDDEGRALVDHLLAEAVAAGVTVVVSAHEPLVRPGPHREVVLAGGRVVP